MEPQTLAETRSRGLPNIKKSLVSPYQLLTETNVVAIDRNEPTIFHHSQRPVIGRFPFAKSCPPRETSPSEIYIWDNVMTSIAALPQHFFSSISITSHIVCGMPRIGKRGASDNTPILRPAPVVKPRDCERCLSPLCRRASERFMDGSQWVDHCIVETDRASSARKNLLFGNLEGYIIGIQHVPALRGPHVSRHFPPYPFCLFFAVVTSRLTQLHPACIATHNQVGSFQEKTNLPMMYIIRVVPPFLSITVARWAYGTPLGSLRAYGFLMQPA
jgi:hypothetical protein